MQSTRLSQKRVGGDSETGPQIPKKCMGEAIKLVKAKLANVDGKLLADITKTYLIWH